MLTFIEHCPCAQPYFKKCGSIYVNSFNALLALSYGRAGIHTQAVEQQSPGLQLLHYTAFLRSSSVTSCTGEDTGAWRDYLAWPANGQARLSSISSSSTTPSFMSHGVMATLALSPWNIEAGKAWSSRSRGEDQWAVFNV